VHLAGPTGSTACPASLTGAAGDTVTFTLQQGEVVEMFSEGLRADLTGTAISADHPIAVFGGHACAQVPLGRDACDHLEEQLFPVETLGNRYVVSSFADRPAMPSLVRIVAPHDGTLVNFDPPSAHPEIRLDANQFADVTLNDNMVVSANHAIIVTQFMYGQGDVGSGSGDPAMVLEVPIDQYRTDYTVLVPDTFVRSFINVVGPTSMPPVVDGMPTQQLSSPIGSSGLSVWNLEVQGGVHRIASPDGMARYGVKVYGVAPYTAYAYPGGLDLQPISPPP
jgi:hypothetical protein